MIEDRPAQLRPESRPQAGLPPHDVAAEEAVIAALMLDEDAYASVLPILPSGKDFFREQNGWCYDAALALADRGQSITVPPAARAPGESPNRVIGTWADTGRDASTARKSTWRMSSRLGPHWISLAKAR